MQEKSEEIAAAKVVADIEAVVEAVVEAIIVSLLVATMDQNKVVFYFLFFLLGTQQRTEEAV